MSDAMRKLGSNGPEVFAIGLGCAAMSPMPAAAADDARSIATLHEAIDNGVNLIDTADFYGSGHNELLIGKAIRGRRDEVLLSVKFGSLRGPDGQFVGNDTRPAALKNYLAYTLTRLGVDHVDIYRPARLDPQVPIEDTIGAIADLVKAGYVRQIGLSEVGPDTILRAHAVHPIGDLQIEYSLVSRQPEDEIFPLLAELGIAVTAYAVLSHGLLTDAPRSADGDASRGHLPRLQGENFEHNRKLVAALREIAQAKGVTTSQLAIAWVLARGAHIVPVIGARRPEQLQEALRAREIELSADDLMQIERAVPRGAVAGERYGAPLMKMLDSERPTSASR